jgi:hypothetical protein
MARCRLEGEDADRWRECAIFDLSMLGLGIDLPNPGIKKLQGRRITVLIELGRSVDMTVSGVVRNAEPSSDGIIRIGAEFIGLSETESAVVGLLEQRAANRFRSKKSALSN